jgi:zinc protease
MKRIFCLCSFLLTSYAILMSQELIPMDSPIRYGKLENGLGYYIRYNNKPEQRADFYIAQNVGAILEEDHQNGLAHFLEHMAFNGTKNFPEKTMLNYMETIGAQFGTNINAYTSLDETVYMLRQIPTIRPAIIDSCLLVLHDWSSFISLEDKEIDKERGVIREEWRTGAHANRRMWKEGNKLKYPGSQYAKRDIIGDTAVINNFTYDALRSYYKKWYRPDLQAIVIVGDIDVNQVESTIKRIFADITKPINPAERIVYQIPDNQEPIVSIVTDPEAKATSFGLEYKQTPLSDAFKKTVPSYYKSITNSLISTMLGNRFDEASQKPLCSFISGGAYYGDIARSKDAFQIEVRAKEGQEKKAFSDLLVEAQRVKQFGFTQAEFERAKTEMLASYEKSYNERDKQKSSSFVREYVGHFLHLEAIPGIAWEYETAKKAFQEEITLEKLNKTAQSYIAETNLVVDISAPQKEGVVLPTKEEVLVAISLSAKEKLSPYVEKINNNPLIPKQPKPGKIVKERYNDKLGTTEWLLSNGVKVILKSTKHKDDEVLFSAFSDGGISLVSKIADLPSAYLTDGIIDNNGLGKFSSIDLEKKLAGKIVSVSPNINEYTEGLSGKSSVKDIETLLQLSYLYFTAPRKDNDAFASQMSQFKTSLANAQKDPRLSFRDSISMFTANHHPRVVLMNVKTIEQAKQKTALKIYKQRFANPADFTYVFVGNINLDSIKPLVLAYLGGLKTNANRENWKDNNVRYPQGKKTCDFDREMKISKASVYIVFSGGMPYNLTNNVNLGALADILDIRYTESIREQEGGTYGVRVNTTVVNKPQEQATLSIQFDTDPAKGEKLVKLVYQQLDSIVANGPLDIDLQKVKLNLLKQYKESQEENGWWMGTISKYERDGINLATEYVDEVNKLSKESIKESLKALMIQQNRLEVFMGPKE